MLEFNCEACGKKVAKHVSSAKKVKHHYCSLKCYGAMRTKNIKPLPLNVECIHCKKKMHRPKCHVRGKIYCSSSHQMKYEYKNGIRNPQKTTEAAHAQIRKFGFKNRDNSYLVRRNKSKKMRDLHSTRMKNGGAAIACQGAATSRPTKPQRRLFEIVKSKYPDAEMEYQIGNRIADIAIPSLKLDVEYDGAYWHQDGKKDEKRDEELKKQGWETVRLREEALLALENCRAHLTYQNEEK